MQLIRKYETRLRSVLKMYLLPLLLCYSVMRVIISTYFSAYSLVFKMLSILLMAALFFIYEKIKPKKIVRGIIFFAIGGVILLICRVLLSVGWNHSQMWFMNWFYVANSSAEDVREYSITVFLFFSFFLASIVYYFAIIRFRASGLMLAVILPFIIYGKRALSISDFDMVLMVTVYLALVFHGKLTADDVKHDTVFNFSYVIACLVFVTFVGMVTMFIPKPDITSYLEDNRNFFDFRINSELNAFSSLNEESSDRFGSNATGELLFKVSTNSGADMLILRRQSFDAFRNDRWVTTESIFQPMASVQSSSSPAGSSKRYFNVMKNAAASYETDDAQIRQVMDFYTNSELYTINDLRRITLEYENSFRPTYLCAELNIETTGSRNSVQIYRHSHSEAYPASYNEDLDNVTYYYYPVTEQLTEFAKNIPFDTEEFKTLLADMREKRVVTSSNYNYIISAIEDYTDSEYYVISDEMKNLAAQITANCKNDYEKAEAIVNYFATGGFTYDMDYIPPDESIDYFMFTSKKGSCTSYATAMTLMARSVGLPARYVEGFAAYEKNPDDASEFLVRDTNAHAFVECFIAGVGWMTFDPTVPEYMVIRNSGNGGGTSFSTIASYLGRAALFIGAGFVLIFIVMLDRIDERIFRIRIHSKPLGRKAILLYQRVIKLLDRSHPKKFEGYTPEQIDEYVKTKLGGNIELLTGLFQSACFGEQEPTKEQFEQTYEQYKQSWKLLAKGKRPEKTKKVKKTPQIQGDL